MENNAGTKQENRPARHGASRWSRAVSILLKESIFLALVLSCSHVDAEELKIAAGPVPMDSVITKVKEGFEKKSGLKLASTDVGPIEGLKQLDTGKVQAVTGALSFNEWMTLAEKTNDNFVPQNYSHIVIGKEVVGIIVSKDVVVKSLTKDQLKGIFTGRITNWRVLNSGIDEEIVVVVSTKSPRMNAEFQRYILDGEPFKLGVIEATTTADAKSVIVGTFGSIAVSPVSAIDETVNAPSVPEFGRPITLITRGLPTKNVQKLIDYISLQNREQLANNQ